jgi:hypothetical protein
MRLLISDNFGTVRRFGSITIHIELATNEMMQQRIDYIHNNPVGSLFVTNASDGIYSSAVDYEGGKGLVDIYFLDWHGVFPKTFGRYGLSETLRPD